MDAKPPGTFGLQQLEALKDLLPGKAILGVAGIVHNLKSLFALAQLKYAAGIEAAGDGLRNVTDGLFQKINVGEIVQIDGGPQFIRQHKLLCRGVIG